MSYVALIHSHVSSWAIALILFTVVLLLMRLGKAKGAKITQMVLRLFYILLLVTGILLMFQVNFALYAVVKGILAFFLIFVMEMILVRGSKGKLVGRNKFIFWLSFFVLLVLVLILGYGKSL